MDSNVWLGAIRFFTVLFYYILYPLFLLLWGLWALLKTLLTPFMHFGLLIIYVVGAPFKLLAQFEPLYLFLGWAVLIGGATGLLLCITYQLLGHALKLSGSPRSAPRTFAKPPVGDLRRRNDGQSISDSSDINERHSRDRQPDSKHESRFSLSEFYADWVDQEHPIPFKDTELISTAIIEEEEDNS